MLALYTLYLCPVAEPLAIPVFRTFVTRDQRIRLDRIAETRVQHSRCGRIHMCANVMVATFCTCLMHIWCAVSSLEMSPIPEPLDLTVSHIQKRSIKSSALWLFVLFEYMRDFLYSGGSP